MLLGSKVNEDSNGACTLAGEQVLHAKGVHRVFPANAAFGYMHYDGGIFTAEPTFDTGPDLMICRYKWLRASGHGNLYSQIPLFNRGPGPASGYGRIIQRRFTVCNQISSRMPVSKSMQTVGHQTHQSCHSHMLISGLAGFKVIFIASSYPSIVYSTPHLQLTISLGPAPRLVSPGYMNWVPLGLMNASSMPTVIPTNPR